MGSPAVPAMSIPLRFAVSENAPINFPFAGHIQSSRSSSPLSAASGGGADSAFASGRGGGTAALSVAASAGAAVEAAALAAATSRMACSEYGSFNAFGDDFTLSPERAAPGGAAAEGLASAPTDGGARSGAGGTPVAGVARRSAVS